MLYVLLMYANSDWFLALSASWALYGIRFCVVLIQLMLQPMQVWICRNCSSLEWMPSERCERCSMLAEYTAALVMQRPRASLCCTVPTSKEWVVLLARLLRLFQLVKLSGGGGLSGPSAAKARQRTLSASSVGSLRRSLHCMARQHVATPGHGGQGSSHCKPCLP